MQHWADVLEKPGFRQAAANLGWLVAERGVRLVLSLAVGILVVRHLGPVRMGALSYCLALVMLLGCVPALGLDAPLKRDVLRFPGRTVELIASALLLRLGAAALAYAGIVAAVLTRTGLEGEEPRLLAVTGLLLFQPALWVSELWMQAQLQARRVVAVQLGALAAASAGRVGLILTDAGVTAFAWVLAFEMALGAAGMFFAARRAGLRIEFGAARRATMRRLLDEAWPLLFASLAIGIYMKIDEVMLRHLAGTAAVGIYAAAVRLSEVWYFLPVALASSLLPALIRARENSAAEYTRRLQQYYDLSAAAGYGLAVPMALAAPWLVRLAYGEAFAAAGPILAVHIWSGIFVFIGVARGQWLVNEGLTRFYLAATAAGAAANVALNLVFIPRWGGLGAAYATVASYALAAWLASYFHPAVRATAVMQTRALLIPLRGWRYLRRS
jgi:PST family polysaccharide transporter